MSAPLRTSIDALRFYRLHARWSAEEMHWEEETDCDCIAIRCQGSLGEPVCQCATDLAASLQPPAWRQKTTDTKEMPLSLQRRSVSWNLFLVLVFCEVSQSVKIHVRRREMFDTRRNRKVLCLGPLFWWRGRRLGDRGTEWAWLVKPALSDVTAQPLWLTRRTCGIPRSVVTLCLLRTDGQPRGHDSRIPPQSGQSTSRADEGDVWALVGRDRSQSQWETRMFFELISSVTIITVFFYLRNGFWIN